MQLPRTTTADRWIFALVVALSFLWGIGTAKAQTTNLDGINPDPALMLNRGVQKELKLSSDQIESASAMARELAETRKQQSKVNQLAIADPNERARQNQVG